MRLLLCDVSSAHVKHGLGNLPSLLEATGQAHSLLVHSKVVSRRLEEGVLDGDRLLSARPLSPVSPPPMVRRGPLNQGTSMGFFLSAWRTGSFAPLRRGATAAWIHPTPAPDPRKRRRRGLNRITTVAVDGPAWVCPCSPRSGSLGLGTEGPIFRDRAWSCCQGCRGPCSR